VARVRDDGYAVGVQAADAGDDEGDRPLGVGQLTQAVRGVRALDRDDVVVTAGAPVELAGEGAAHRPVAAGDHDGWPGHWFKLRCGAPGIDPPSHAPAAAGAETRRPGPPRALGVTRPSIPVWVTPSGSGSGTTSATCRAWSSTRTT